MAKQQTVYPFEYDNTKKKGTINSTTVTLSDNARKCSDHTDNGQALLLSIMNVNYYWNWKQLTYSIQYIGIRLRIYIACSVRFNCWKTMKIRFIHATSIRIFFLGESWIVRQYKLEIISFVFCLVKDDCGFHVHFGWLHKYVKILTKVIFVVDNNMDPFEQKWKIKNKTLISISSGSIIRSIELLFRKWLLIALKMLPPKYL